MIKECITHQFLFRTSVAAQELLLTLDIENISHVMHFCINSNIEIGITVNFISVYCELLLLLGISRKVNVFGAAAGVIYELALGSVFVGITTVA